MIATYTYCLVTYTLTTCTIDNPQGLVYLTQSIICCFL